MTEITLTELIKVVQQLPSFIMPSNEYKGMVQRSREHRVMSDIENEKQLLHVVNLPTGDIFTQLDQSNVTDQNFDWLVRNKILITEDEFKAILTQGEAIVGFLCP